MGLQTVSGVNPCNSADSQHGRQVSDHLLSSRPRRHPTRFDIEIGREFAQADDILGSAPAPLDPVMENGRSIPAVPIGVPGCHRWRVGRSGDLRDEGPIVREVVDAESLVTSTTCGGQ